MVVLCPPDACWSDGRHGINGVATYLGQARMPRPPAWAALHSSDGTVIDLERKGATAWGQLVVNWSCLVQASVCTTALCPGAAFAMASDA